MQKGVHLNNSCVFVKNENGVLCKLVSVCKSEFFVVSLTRDFNLLFKNGNKQCSVNVFKFIINGSK